MDETADNSGGFFNNLLGSATKAAGTWMEGAVNQTLTKNDPSRQFTTQQTPYGPRTVGQYGQGGMAGMSPLVWVGVAVAAVAALGVVVYAVKS